MCKLGWQPSSCGLGGGSRMGELPLEIVERPSTLAGLESIRTVRWLVLSGQQPTRVILPLEARVAIQQLRESLRRGVQQWKQIYGANVL